LDLARPLTRHGQRKSHLESGPIHSLAEISTFPAAVFTGNQQDSLERCD